MAGSSRRAMVVQNPYEMGYKGTRLMTALYQKDFDVVKEIFPEYDSSSEKFNTANGDIHHTNIRVVVPADSPLKKSDFDDSVTFYSIQAFDKWLKERKLTGS